MDGYFELLRRPDPDGALRLPADAARPGVTVLIPTYTPTGGDRSTRLRRCLHSVPAADATFVIVDNGLCAPARAQLTALLSATGRPHLVVDAPAGQVGTGQAAAGHAGTAQTGAAGAEPGPRRRYTTAAARNAGLAALAALPDTHPVRREFLLFLDDDTVLAPDALPALVAALRDRPAAIAACPRVVPVADPGHWLAGRPPTAGTAAAGAPAVRAATPHRLPGPIRDGRYDLLSVTSHGSLVTGRTVGLLVRQAPVLANLPLFFPGTPYGSSEDMLAMAALSRLGQLWSVPAAQVADEARDAPGSTRIQQYAWGFDHAWLAGALARAGLVPPGVHVLSWRDGRWRHERLDWGPATGFLINPAEVLLGYRMLTAVAGNPAAAQGLFGPDAGPVRDGLPRLGRVLWRHARGAGRTADPRPDLPALAGRDWSGLRDGLDSLLGHLAGNVAGSADHSFLYGARQPAVATPGVSSTSIERSRSWSSRSAS
ncbi:glycosyltransferase [Plantactinospora sp. KBS50]|uniref:glycosyltransferase n=1 Tax=Plantactinospora sp. KBS50 TaxID=2024580 RepID=UPI000BAAA308|nr:glycosyltransferase [Plantactinospora sp. KBS50]ASW54853.1 hypothetical protein CIK06_12655 [Plantactinospora sp. KBS50]